MIGAYPAQPWLNLTASETRDPGPLTYLEADRINKLKSIDKRRNAINLPAGSLPETLELVPR